MSRLPEWLRSRSKRIAESVGSLLRAALNSSASMIKIGAKIVSHGRYVTFQMAEVAVPRLMFRDILMLIARLRTPPAPA